MGPAPVTVAESRVPKPMVIGLGEAVTAVLESAPTTVNVAKPDSMPPQVTAAL